MNSSSFKIPMWLCMRPSITQEDYQDHHLSKWDTENSKFHQQGDNKENKSKKSHNRSSSSCSIDKDAPGSPKVGCMGQVKHNTHQQQLTFLSANNQHTTSNKRYFKLNKMFSSNSFSYARTTSRTNHMITATTTTTTTGPNNSKLLLQHHNHNTKDQQEQHAASSSESSSSSLSESSSSTTTSSSSFSLASVGDLDPPLPVIKRSLTTTNACNGDVSSIWKRRCGGEVALKGLQLSSTIKRPIK
ncbi:GATA zinc finger domain-containing protein 18-like [Papaver somniferum]|uniref:GATA zinc finger domain-containing protein 18-like n=1 Tax=Papaver somniferum TaxID=3469 RepID=UPI000E7016D7|nr:GATA zinc finger domain-containing protein 18-like [Papaver somniferum]